MIEHLQDSIQNDFPACENVTVTIHEIAPQLRQTSAPAYYLIAPLDSGGYHNIFTIQTAMPTRLPSLPPWHMRVFPVIFTRPPCPISTDWNRCAPFYPFRHIPRAGLPMWNICLINTPDCRINFRSVLALNESIVLSLYASADIGIHYYGWDCASLLNF